jgi:hypothetical protein
MAGTVTQDQFLESARRLYASSQQYKTEFAFAQQFPGRGLSSSVQSGGGNSSGLSPIDRQRLADLLEEKKKLDAADQLQQFRELAQQIANIQSATGENLQQILSEMGVTNIDDVVKGLGLANEDALNTYIENIKAQQEADGNGTKSIVDVLTEILATLRGGATDGTNGLNEPGGAKPFGAGSGNSDGGGNAPGIPTGGRDWHGAGGRNFTDADIDAMTDGLARALDRPYSGNRRGGRLEYAA